jgi:hypothetical protein
MEVYRRFSIFDSFGLSAESVYVEYRILSVQEGIRLELYRM